MAPLTPSFTPDSPKSMASVRSTPPTVVAMASRPAKARILKFLPATQPTVKTMASRLAQARTLKFLPSSHLITTTVVEFSSTCARCVWPKSCLASQSSASISQNSLNWAASNTSLLGKTLNAERPMQQMSEVVVCPENQSPSTCTAVGMSDIASWLAQCKTLQCIRLSWYLIGSSQPEQHVQGICR